MGDYRRQVQIYVKDCHHQMLLYYIIVDGSYRRLSPFPLKNLNYQVMILSYFIYPLLFSYITDIGSYSCVLLWCHPLAQVPLLKERGENPIAIKSNP